MFVLGSYPESSCFSMDPRVCWGTAGKIPGGELSVPCGRQTHGYISQESKDIHLHLKQEREKSTIISLSVLFQSTHPSPPLPSRPLTEIPPRNRVENFNEIILMFTTSKNVPQKSCGGRHFFLLFLCITLLPEDVTWQVLTRSIGIFLAT